MPLLISSDGDLWAVDTTVQVLLRLFYSYVSRSLFKADRLSFSLHLTHGTSLRRVAALPSVAIPIARR